jgi:methyltransferase (TIGR00027 family)
MTRSEHDTWDLASSVGATATMVAASRALASRRPNPLIRDPYAQPLVEAVGIDALARLARGELEPKVLDTDPKRAERMSDHMAVRTKFFDDFFLDATAAGIRQAVILASGLDARAYRLGWPASTTVYEIDQPEVIEFKTETLARLGANPTADRRAVAVDLRRDWPAALKAAGFDPDQPSAWSAEGLLGYLPPEAQDRLLDNVTALSAEGSRFATETLADMHERDEHEVRERMEQVSARWRDHGFDLDMTSLIYFGDRNEAAGYLDTHGWETVGSRSSELVTRYGLEPFDEETLPLGDVIYVSATLKQR